MLEGLVAWVVNTYVGEFFEDLNAAQLSVGILQGEVELENLPLKKDAFNFLNYPLEIRSGCIGKIRLQIPVYRLHSEPWVIFIEKLYVVVGPVTSVVYNGEKETKDAQDRKMSCLQDHETQLKAAKEGKQGSNYSVYSNWVSYSTSFLANIIENIQLNVRDVHIRYEDDVCCKNKQFACGLIVRGLAAQSTDENWVPMFVKKDSSEMTWKLAQLEGLSVYWDTCAAMLGQLPLQQMMEGMTKHLDVCVSPSGGVSERECIVSSVDASARLKRNCSAEALKSPLNPRIVCDINLEKIPLYFNQNQYQQISQWEKSFNSLCVKWQNRKWRPSVPVSDCPRDWWRYAVSAYVEPVRPKKLANTWDHVLQHARDIKEYYLIYKESLKNNETLSYDMKVRKEQLELKLELDVLLKLRELAVDEMQRKKPVVSNDDKQVAKGGVLQWLFPRWVGWYSSSATDVKEETVSQDVTKDKEAVLEEEILTVLNSAAGATFLKRDALFVQLNFCLLKGSFVLLRNEKLKSPVSGLQKRSGVPVVELEFSDVFIKLETKPRTRSLLFDIKLGALYIHDRTFNTSHFPYIIAAQNQEDIYFTSSQPNTTLFPFRQQKVEVTEDTDVNRWLFELLYEKNPQDVSSYYKLYIRTKPLDVICNLDLIRIVVDIFTSVDHSGSSDLEITSLPSAASAHYEHFKEHTKAELQHTWDRMLIGEKKSKKEWCVNLQISAPQIFIPENVFDPNTNVVIFVLGDLHVSNFSQERKSPPSVDDNTFDNEEDFYTPFSTPEECVELPMDVVEVSESCKTEDLLVNRLYESYALELQNMQVLVSSLKDSWKFAQLRGSSSLHILDRFSINIQIYRRTFLTQDPHWPSFVFIGSLPKLTAHISELKVGAVKACIEDLESYFTGSGDLMDMDPDSFEVLESHKVDDEQHKCEDITTSVAKSHLSKSFYMMIQFSVDQMSFDIQGQNQSVAELQVAGVKTRFSMHHSETLLMLTVHSLLVVDALQTYGPDFELLVASHKHVCMDNSSGTIMNRSSSDLLDSISSPLQPQSPTPVEKPLPWAEEAPDDEALIFLEFKASYGATGEGLYSANVKFNNLDVIANQETIVELVGLLKGIGIGGQKSHSNSLDALRSRSKSQMEMFLKNDTSKFEITFNFRLLNVLLLRAMSQSTVAQKLATATVNDAQIKAAIGSSTEIFGTLGGVQVLDLVTEGTQHQKVISLGKENPLLDKSCTFERSGIADDSVESIDECYSDALSFRIVQRDIRVLPHSLDQNVQLHINDETSTCQLDVYLRMASLYYVHSPYMLYELSCCAAEFKSYLKSIAYSIKTAATEMAKGIVNVHITQLDRETVHDSLTWPVSVPPDDDIGLNLSCDVFMKSPIIILPLSCSSPDFFMARLGHIALHNSHCQFESGFGASVSHSAKEDLLCIDVSGMSLFYVNSENEDLCGSVGNEFAYNLPHGEHLLCPIVHDTTIEVTVYPFQDTVSTACGLNKLSHFGSNLAIDGADQSKQVKVEARVTSPLNVDFTKQHYIQMLKLLTSLSSSYQMPSQSVSLVDQAIEDKVAHRDDFGSHILSSKSTTSFVSHKHLQHSVLVCSSLHLPSLKIELREYMNEKSGLVSLVFQEFALKYDQLSSSEVSIEATLSSLLMEDLQDNSNTSRTSVLISSSSKKSSHTIDAVYLPPYLSSSCPNIHKRLSDALYSMFSPSLPDNLCTENLFSQQSDSKAKIGMKSLTKRRRMSSYPNTPPPSPSTEGLNNTRVPSNALVTLHALISNQPSDISSLVQRKSLSVDLDFNCLDIVFSLYPWNVILDFFSLGSITSNEEPFGKPPMPDIGEAQSVQQSSTHIIYDANVTVCVKSLTVVISKPEYDLASANISNFYSQLSKTEDDFNLKGSLASISILDLTPMGQMYPERLITTGTEALQFDISRGKSLVPNSSRKEVHVKGQLSSITYVHTQRLITEITVFFNYFHRKQYTLTGMNPPLPVAREQRYTSHSPHIVFNVTAVSPIIVIPSDALSANLIIIKLRTITLSNVIMSEGKKDKHLLAKMTKGFIQKSELSLVGVMTPCDSSEGHNPCTDVTALVFRDVTLYSGVRVSLLQGESNDKFANDDKILFPSYTVVAQENFLQKAFTFNLQIERNICAPIPKKVSEIKLGGTLSSVHVTLDLEQYQLIRSIFQYNFGETLEEGIYDPCKEVGQFVLVTVNEEVSPVMSWSIELQNVTLELCSTSQSRSEKGRNMLAKFDFIKSHLSYVVFSNNRKDVDFFSTEIRIFDVRYKDWPANKHPNVFTNILLPNKESSSSTLQAELHYRMKNNLTKITVLLNNMKVMGIMDFIKSTLGFLSTPLQSNNLRKQSSQSEPQTESYMEMKINVTDTEFVLVEDSSGLDSSAVIIKTTAVIDWKPHDSEKPMSFNLQQFEVFSCILGIEDETALSIIDPANLGIDLVNKHSSPIAKLEFEEEILCVLEVSSSNLYMRFSYYDLVMFIKILESLKRQIGVTQSQSSAAATIEDTGKDAKVLADLGFSVSDCQKALNACHGNLTDAALWLTQNATPALEASNNVTTNQQTHCNGDRGSGGSGLQLKNMALFSVEVRIDTIGICIIDDCREADVPVLEFHLADVCVTQKSRGNQEGYGMFTFSLDYYNCSVSGWEPLVEPWRCEMKWSTSRSYEESTKKLTFSITSGDVVNLNITSSFMKLFNMVKDNWSEDFSSRSCLNHSDANFNKTRLQLMPFVLKNKTGCKLWFATQVLTSEKFQSYHRSRESELVWKSVENWETSLFTFGKRVKLRHQDSHQETFHQIIVRVEGWQVAVPVSVDRVGVYFRNIYSVDGYSGSNGRIVFKVKLENNAQKSITIESALSIVNKLDDFLEVRLECPDILYKVPEAFLFISPNETLPMPLPYVRSQIWIRPSDKSFSYCDSPVQWYDVTKPGEIIGIMKICNPSRLTSKPYRMCVCIKHGNYPENGELPKESSARIRIAAGHTIIVLPCLEVHNILPCELKFSIADLGVIGSLKPWKKQSVCSINIGRSFTFGIGIDNFREFSNTHIYSTSRHHPSILELRDIRNRVLFLHLRVTITASYAMRIVVYAPYWIVNKTGLPVILKQDGTQVEAAGQFEEHEIARSITPLLFSFYDDDASAMCTMRIGKKLHSEGMPAWCSRFRLEKGIQVRSLRVSRNDSRPDWVYNIGIEVTSGKGMCKDSSIVTLSPRFLFDNRSTHTLEFSQKFAINQGRNLVLSATPGCSFPFHWPRIDLDNLLCVRIANIPHCHWSGGFAIGSIKSFFINMRDSDGTSHFLQTEIVLHGATFYVIFTDAGNFPPPIRIDNYSEVSVTYYQTNISEERLKTTVRPHTSVPYALDEPMLPPYITCSAPGGSAATYNMNIFREGSQLFYENFIYIAFTATLTNSNDLLRRSDTSQQFLANFMDEELVLDVPSGSRVILSKKEPGKRSQLWRMTSGEMLQHEGSSPPCDLTKSHSSSPNVQKFVLDIAGLGPQPNEFTPLVLRKPDARRRHTQTWRFTPDGRLCCGYPNMYVQLKDGCLGLKAGSSVVLGPTPQFESVMMDNGIPVEQAVCRQKLRGGCGVLSVKVIPDGPTRVLMISDLKQKVPSSDSINDETGSTSSPLVMDRKTYFNVEKKKRVNNHLELQFYLKLIKGIGVSVVNHLNEDLIYIMMHDIMVEFCKLSSTMTLDGSLKSIQIDNQLLETEWPVFLSVTPSSKSDSQRHLPAAHFTVQFTETSLKNARIFKHFIVTFKNLTIYAEEYLVLKLLQFLGLGETSDDVEVHETDNELQSSLFRHVTNDPRYYFSTLKLALQQVRLSVHTTDHVTFDLHQLKSKLGLRLISFEDAAINLDPFLKVHPFETSHFLIESIVDHYKQELKSQAAKILGAVDFLGNPLGLMNDINDGLSEFIHEGSVGGLIKNVAHGLSDSAAKLSESLSDGLGSVAIDEKHQMMRKQIRHGSNSKDNHLIAGFRGLGIGLLGGVTSIFTETYEGATQEGLQGLLAGFGKGLVGTVAKPAVGFLDLASGAASAVRDTSKRSLVQPHRRPPRMTVGPGGLLPVYSLQQALDQELLYSLNKKKYAELFVAKEILRSGTEDLQVLVSSEKVYFLNISSSSRNKIVLIVSLGDLLDCSYVQPLSGSEARHYIQLRIKDDSPSRIKLSNSRNYPLVENDEWSCKKPRVRCDSGEVAEKVVMQINYAKSLYEERRYIITEIDELDFLP